MSFPTAAVPLRLSFQCCSSRSTYFLWGPIACVVVYAADTRLFIFCLFLTFLVFDCRVDEARSSQKLRKECTRGIYEVETARVKPFALRVHGLEVRVNCFLQRVVRRHPQHAPYITRIYALQAYLGRASPHWRSS